MDTKKAFEDLLDSAVSETGAELQGSREALAMAMADSATRLAVGAGEPGFERMVRMERNSLAMLAGLAADDAAVSADGRLLSLITTGIRVVAFALL